MNYNKQTKQIAELKKKWVGKKWPVWWNGDEGNMATILDVKPYTGSSTSVACIFKLSCNGCHRGWLEMSIPDVDLRNA